MKWPTLEEVEKADTDQLQKWLRELPYPKNQEQMNINSVIFHLYFEVVK